MGLVKEFMMGSEYSLCAKNITAVRRVPRPSIGPLDVFFFFKVSCAEVYACLYLRSIL